MVGHLSSRERACWEGAGLVISSPLVLVLVLLRLVTVSISCAYVEVKSLVFCTKNVT